MKKKHFLVIVYVLLILALGISLYNIFNPNKTPFGVMFKSYYDIMESDINLIETNMNEITTSNDNWDWWKLKETNIEDKKLKSTYNSLVSDIRTCYLISSDSKDKDYDNIKILSFKDKKTITEKQLLQLSKNENCLKNFDKYNSMVLSDNHELSEKIKNQIRIIVDHNEEAFNYKQEFSNYENFVGILYGETDIISRVASLSSWLKIEYHSR